MAEASLELGKNTQVVLRLRVYRAASKHRLRDTFILHIKYQPPDAGYHVRNTHLAL